MSGGGAQLPVKRVGIEVWEEAVPKLDSSADIDDGYMDSISEPGVLPNRRRIQTADSEKIPPSSIHMALNQTDQQLRSTLAPYNNYRVWDFSSLVNVLSFFESETEAE